MNNVMSSYNLRVQSISKTVEFSQQMGAAKHVDKAYRTLNHQVSEAVAVHKQSPATTTNPEHVLLQEQGTPMECRPQFVSGVLSLMKYFDRLIPDPHEKTQINALHGTGVNIFKGDIRERQPWVFLEQIAEGRSGPVGFSQGSLRTWDEHLLHWLEHNEKAFH